MNLTIKEMKLIVENMRGFSGVETMMICSKLTSEIERIEELEALDFDDECESCKL